MGKTSNMNFIIAEPKAKLEALSTEILVGLTFAVTIGIAAIVLLLFYRRYRKSKARGQNLKDMARLNE